MKTALVFLAFRCGVSRMDEKRETNHSQTDNKGKEGKHTVLGGMEG